MAFLKLNHVCLKIRRYGKEGRRQQTHHSDGWAAMRFMSLSVWNLSQSHSVE